MEQVVYLNATHLNWSAIRTTLDQGSIEYVARAIHLGRRKTIRTVSRAIRWHPLLQMGSNLCLVLLAWAQLLMSSAMLLLKWLARLRNLLSLMGRGRLVHTTLDRVNRRGSSLSELAFESLGSTFGCYATTGGICNSVRRMQGWLCAPNTGFLLNYRIWLDLAGLCLDGHAIGISMRVVRE